MIHSNSGVMDIQKARGILIKRYIICDLSGHQKLNENDFCEYCYRLAGKFIKTKTFQQIEFGIGLRKILMGG